jgi:hypothetical protein
VNSQIRSDSVMFISALTKSSAAEPSSVISASAVPPARATLSRLKRADAPTPIA